MSYAIIPAQDPGTGTVAPGDLTGFTATRIPFGDSATALTTSANLTFTTATSNLKVGATAVDTAYALDLVDVTLGNMKWGNGTRLGQLSWSGTSVVIGSTSAHPISFTAGGAEKFRILSDGTATWNNSGALDSGLTYDFREISSGSHCFAQFKCSNNAASSILYLYNSTTNVQLELRASGSGATGTTFGIANGTTVRAVGRTNAAFLIGNVGNEKVVFGTNDVERARIDAAGNFVHNTAAIATNATDGFLYVPSCAGTPTGTPTSYSGRVPIVVDTTNHKLYFYDGSWRDAGP